MDGPDKGSVYTGSEVTVNMKVTKPGVIYASSQCNLHGLWSSQKELQLG
jgi:superoxide reductase